MQKKPPPCGQAHKYLKEDGYVQKPKVWRGLTAVCALFLVFSMMAAYIFELYRTSVDAFFGTRSQVMVTSESDDAEDAQ